MIPSLTGLSYYKGYYLRGPFFHPDTDNWGAYTGAQGAPWFEAATEAALKQKIDEALAAVPPPVY